MQPILLCILVPAKSMFKPARQIYMAHMVQLSSFLLRWQLSFVIEVQEGPRYKELNPVQLKAHVIFHFWT